MEFKIKIQPKSNSRATIVTKRIEGEVQLGFTYAAFPESSCYFKMESTLQELDF